MDRHTVIFVTDLRQQHIGEFLPGNVRTLSWTDEGSEMECLSQIRQANYVVLPTPAAKISKTKDMSEILKYNLTNCKMIFGGKISPEWRDWFEKKGIVCYDFLEDEKVAWENAYITAEATVAEILKHTCYSIRDQKIVVAGYGKCGKCVAGLLGRMGAKVTVFARSHTARKEAKRDGHSAVDFSYAVEEAYGTRTFVNTVPACVFTEGVIAEMHSDAIIVDIASAPGGCDLSAAKKYKIPVISALGLPGIYTTKSSAGILADAISRQMPPKHEVREEKSWISQIII